MPQLQSLVLTDRTPTTPVNITFDPQEITPEGVASLAQVTGVPVGEKRCSVSMRKRNTRFKGEFRLVLPVLVTETINGVSNPTVVRTSYATLSVDYDERSTLQERNDLIGLVASALGTSKTLVNNTLVNLERVW